MALIKTDGSTYLKEEQNFLIIYMSLEQNNRTINTISNGFHEINKEYYNFDGFVTGKHQF